MPPSPVRTSFNPGPSQLAPGVFSDLREIEVSGLLAASHRSSQVKEMLRDAVRATRTALGVPDDYAVVFQPSATASMELVVRNLATTATGHFVGGAFAKRFVETAEAVGLDTARIDYPWPGSPEPDADVPPGVELVTVTHNETSTGAAWPLARLADLRSRIDASATNDAGAPLLAVDVTSSLGGVRFDFRMADIWFASVQKALGLPAGLALVIAGPRALERARGLGANRRVAPWQDLAVLAEKIESGQTVETPNVLGIALLGRRMARLDLDAAALRCLELAAEVARAGSGGGLDFEWFVERPEWRSPTIQNLVVPDPAAWIVRARKAGFVLGSGYGDLKDRCVRIATFPAHDPEDLAALLEVLKG